MSLHDLTTAFQRIESGNYDTDFDGTKSEELIVKAENALGIKFPPTYRLFLQRYGCGHIDGDEIFGIIDDNFEVGTVPDGIWYTLYNRKKGLPSNLILIYALGNGELFALDSNQENEGEYPVVAFMLDLTEHKRYEQIASDFGEFLLQLIKNDLPS